jgi:hypothetical protein
LKKDSEWPLVIFPSFVAKTKEVERAVVTILYDEKKPEVQVKAGSEEETKPGRISFAEFIHSLPAPLREAFRKRIDRWIKEGYTYSFGTQSFNLFTYRGRKKKDFFWVYPEMANVIREERAKKLGLPKGPYRKYLASLMKSPAISRVIASGGATLDLKPLSVGDVALLLKSTDGLARSLPPPL